MSESAKPSVGERLRIFRESKKLTQAQFAKAVGATTIGIQGNESNRSLPNSKLLIGLHGMGLNVNWLLSGDGPMLTANLQDDATPQLVDSELLEGAINAIDKITAERGLSLSNKKRAKLAALAYQYHLQDKAEEETAEFLSKLVELASS